MNIKFETYDESVIIDKINSLLTLAKLTLTGNHDLYFKDLFFWSAIDKSLKLIDSFLFAFERRNITVLAALTRMQIDCVLRTFATTLVDDSEDFCKKVLCNEQQINHIKDKTGKKMTDKYLCESLGTFLNLPIYDLYKKVSGFVHFSSISFFNSVRSTGDNSITMKISKENIFDDEATYKRLSIELANQFYYFGRILIECIVASWIIQKRNDFNN